MKLYIFISALLTVPLLSDAQDAPFFAKGYLIYNKDTTWCKIWFDPQRPQYKGKIIVQYDEQQVREILFIRKDSLDGFGIIEKDYVFHYGKVNFKGWNFLATVYPRKLVAGTVELMKYRTASYTYGIQNDPTIFKHYYINRTDVNRISLPKKITSLKMKKIVPFIREYPELEKKLTMD